MTTDDSTRASASPLDLASAPMANVLDWDDPQPLGASSSQNGKCRRHWRNLPEDDNP